MNVLSILFPQTVYKTSSAFSGTIEVIDHVFERRLVVGSLTQSGGIVKWMWEKVLGQKYITRSTGHVKNVLILGLGAGTVVNVIHKKWPSAKITGVEIDQEIIEVGKRYFGLDAMYTLDIVIDNAIGFVDGYFLKVSRKKFDLIIVDLYKGKNIEKRSQNDRFLKKIAQIMAKNGIVIFNVVRLQNDNSEAGIFLDKLSGIFKDIFCKGIIVNDFFFCKSPAKNGLNHHLKGGELSMAKKKKKKKR